MSYAPDCSGNNSLLSCFILIIFHTIIVHDQRVCHELAPGHIYKVKVTVYTKPKSVSGP